MLGMGFIIAFFDFFLRIAKCNLEMKIPLLENESSRNINTLPRVIGRHLWIFKIEKGASVP